MIDTVIAFARSQLSVALLALAGLLTLAFVVTRLARARAAARVADPDGNGHFDLTGVEPVPKLELIDLRGPTQTVRIGRAFAPPGTARARRERGVPLFLGIGSEGGGKSTAMAYAELRQPFGQPREAFDRPSPPAVMWSFDRARLLDIAGFLVDPVDDVPADGAAWRSVLRRVRRARRRRPADGIVLSVASGDLAAAIGTDRAAKAARSRLAARASAVRDRLVEAQMQLGMSLPVFVQITKCDLLPGFAAWIAGLEAVERNQMIGWSNPADLDEPYSASAANDALQGMSAVLARLQIETFSKESLAVSDADRLAFAALPVTLSSLETALTVYLNQVFVPGAGYAPFPLRGIYLLSGDGFDHAPSAYRSDGLITTSRADQPAHRTIFSLSDLLSYKVFYEWSLGAPTARAARRATRRRRLARGLSIVLALGGPLALWWQAQGVRTAGTELAVKVLAPASQALAVHPGRDTATDLAGTCSILGGMDTVGDYRLRRFLLPASWRSAFATDVTMATEGVWTQLIFPHAARQLGGRLSLLATGASDPEAGPIASCARPGGRPAASSTATPGLAIAITDLRSVPSYRALDRMTENTAAFEHAVAAYGCFGPDRCLETRVDPLASLNRLIAAVYGQRLSLPSATSRSFVRDTLDAVRLEAPYRPDAEHAAGMTARATHLGIAMIDSLYRRNVVIQGLGSLEQQITDLERRPPERDAIERYRHVIRTIDRAKTDLARPEVAWIGRSTIDLGDAYRSLLGRIAANTLLLPMVATAIDQHAETEFVDLRDRLGRVATPNTGPLLARDADDVPILALSDPVLALRDALGSLVGEPFMDESPEQILTINPPEGRYLLWQVAHLENALTLYDRYQAFVGTDLASFGGLRDSTAVATRGELERNMLDRVALAQAFRHRGRIFLPDQREDFIARQVSNLRDARDALHRLLDAFTEPPFGTCSGTEATAYCQLSAVLVTQQHAILSALDTLLTERAPYQPLPELGGWSGGDDLAQLAFGLSDPDALADAVASKRQTVQRLAERYAKPTLEGLPLEDPWGLSDQIPTRRFEGILADFDGVTSKRAGNAVERLEGFIQDTMATTTAATCLRATSASLRGPPPFDFFLAQRTSLAAAVAARCRSLTFVKGRAAYDRLVDAFNQRLAGRFPFSAGDFDPRAQQAKPTGVAVVLGIFDRERVAIENLLSLTQPAPDEPDEGDPAARQACATHPPIADDRTPQVRRFIDDLACVRVFFADYLATLAKEPSALPAFDVDVAFRINQEPARERGGNAILHWTFAIDGREVDPAAAEPARWTLSEPVALTLQWAKNGPVAPMAPGTNPYARLDGHQVIFAFENNWSLIHLLRNQQAPPGRVDPAAPETLLRFEVPTRTAEGKTEMARVFARISLVTGTDDPVMLRLPTFAHRAPTLPAGIE